MQKTLPDHIIINERQSKMMGTWPQAIGLSSILFRRYFWYKTCGGLDNTIEKFGFHIIDKTMYIFKTT